MQTDDVKPPILGGPFDAEEAGRHHLCPSVLYRDLRVEELFRFPGSPIIYQRTRSGYRRLTGSNVQRRVFRTGANVAVILVTKE